MPVKTFSFFIVYVLASSFLLSCKKDNTINTPVLSEFVSSATLGKYFIKNDPNSVFKIPVGITTVSNSPRTINFEVSSPTGAVDGHEYSLGTSSITIPAGTSVDSISLKGIYAAYDGGRIDTLVFTITGGDVSTFKNSAKYSVVLQQYCDVDLNSFLGTYSNCFDNGNYGPYEINVLSAVATGPTTGYLMVENLWDAGGATPIRVNLDWSDPSNFTTYVPADQPLYNDPSYGLAKVAPDGTGIFTSCNVSFTFIYEVYVDGNTFGTTSTTMER
ncbi:MAG: hypothetical protein ABIO82_06660 [Ginsengibacter sp.]